MNRLEDLDFVDDVDLLSHNHEGMQSKLTRIGKTLGLRISKSKTKGMRINTTNTDRLELDGEILIKWRTLPTLALTSARMVGLIGTYK